MPPSRYPEFGYHLNKTGRPMVYSCSWPVYQIYAGMACWVIIGLNVAFLVLKDSSCQKERNHFNLEVECPGILFVCGPGTVVIIIGQVSASSSTLLVLPYLFVLHPPCSAIPVRPPPSLFCHTCLSSTLLVLPYLFVLHPPCSAITPNFTSIIQHCNLWRNFDDIQDTWVSVESIIDYYGNNQDTIVPNAGPGHWNDPDMLIIGNFGLSYEQSKTQMALWAILAAPLLMSVDLRTIRPEYKAILQNKKIIAVDQDPLGYQGRRIYKHNGIEIWARPITPFYQTYFSYAVLFLNRRTDGTPSDVAVTLRELGLSYPGGYNVEDLYEDVNYGVLTPQTKIKVKVNPSGVVLLRADIQPQFEASRQLQTPYDPYNQIFQVQQNYF
uniref:Alpha galactosidase A C-terminal domain-containing protein n=1 Tax=Timema genevievae TaxID=629358 RepID=A0A7R9K6E4_TIMGE|nr:unnamed protein product [Timema genevievae]